MLNQNLIGDSMITNLVILVGAIVAVIVGYNFYTRYLALRSQQELIRTRELVKARRQTEWNKLNNYKDVTQKNRRMNFDGDSYFTYNEEKKAS